ncbi:MAG: beta-ketoacyl-ACP synthase II [Bacteroidales bacterium]|jgi:3-oxoacyl-[acyl-carrier-protein] synthase II|nr:beta-ketoacyl-ACP synthase II [Bacteroidales bacterium]MCB9029052.1 beta-ketoacyl-ACP synthase II [Bacteroidales bacterium]HNT93319.1 beta-ketoacyl-ACP synthase II [Bacteroidales bacterium]HOO66608.1 beta-ketoacyl-ACP synthase II [Bacteroidales bacterium]HPE22355.1 beta-ketoacyl-ACP synthase II [Bacteroidales bacterium]
MRRVVVTGMGALTPIGNNLQEYWKGLVEGASGAAFITHFDTSKFKTRFACEIKNYNPADYFDRKESRKMDRYTQYAHIAADEAVKDAGLDPEATDKDRSGIIWASGIGGIETFLEEVKGFVMGDGTPRFSPFFIPKMISDIAAGMLSIKYGFRGPNFATVSACSSSTNAIIDAYYYILLGKADLFIAGGSEASVNPPGIGGFNSMQAMSTNNEEYATASRPFDVTRDGFVIGEGAGALILEELGHARARGARIYAEVIGSGLTADAYHITAPHPDGMGAVNVMKQAIEEAGVQPSDVDYINVHGTATPLGDIAEAKAILQLFGEHAYKLNISATKSMTGHLLGAAGAIEAIATIMAVVHDIVPPTINFRYPDPAIDPNLNLTLNKAQHRPVKVALSNNFGFGGHNASILLRKFEE